MATSYRLEELFEKSYTVVWLVNLHTDRFDIFRRISSEAIINKTVSSRKHAMEYTSGNPISIFPKSQRKYVVV